ncbi:hypothetical protein NMG60_11020003 [Bertholletia excelsa]
MLLVAQMEALGLCLDAISYVCLIAALGNAGRTVEADAIFQDMLHSGIKLRLKVDNILLAGRMEDTLSIIGKMRKDGSQLNSFVYSKVIGLYRDNGMWKKAMDIVQEIKEMEVSLDKRLLSCLLKMLEQGLYPDPNIFLTIISRLGEQGKWDMIKKNYENMKCRASERSGIILCNFGYKKMKLLARGRVEILRRKGLCEQTVKVLQLMEVEGIEPNLIMLNVLINAFSISGRHLEAFSIYRYMKESAGPGVLLGISLDVVTYSKLMKAFMRLRKFDQVPIIHKEMESSGCTPDRKAREMLQSALMVLEQKRHL